VSKLVGVLYHPRIEEARTLSVALKDVLEQKGYQVWAASAWEEKNAKDLLPGTQAVVSIGGDGTIMRAARIIIPATAPILGIRYGRLGFLAELDPADALARVPAILERPPRTDLRSMLQATCMSTLLDPSLNEKHYPLMAGNGDSSLHALNDIAVARGSAGRPINVTVTIDGQLYATYRTDGVILSTATGSTAYSFSAGGPVLHPTSEDFVLTPVSPQATFNNALVLRSTSMVQLMVTSDHGAILSIDGQIDVPLEDGETVTVQKSPYHVSFLRASAQDSFYGELLARLRFGENLGL